MRGQPSWNWASIPHYSFHKDSSHISYFLLVRKKTHHDQQSRAHVYLFSSFFHNSFLSFIFFKENIRFHSSAIVFHLHECLCYTVWSPRARVTDSCKLPCGCSPQDSFHQQQPHVISEVLSKDGLWTPTHRILQQNLPSPPVQNAVSFLMASIGLSTSGLP
jgi:hypothetical protein